MNLRRAGERSAGPQATPDTLTAMHRSRLTAPIAILLSAAAFGLAGCTPVPSGPGPSTPEAPVQEPDAGAELHPDGSAEQNLPYFDATLRQFAAGEQAVEGRPIVDSLAAAGFEKSSMQVSFDRSKTDLVADSIFVSARFGEGCLIGQVVTGDRSVVTTVQPAVGPEQNVCLIGNTRAIDWD